MKLRRVRSWFSCPMTMAMLLVANIAIGAPDDPGQAAPNVVARQLDGATFDLAALRGRVVILNLWAIWCAPCRAEMPMLEAFYRAHQADGVALVGLSADDPHDRRDVEKIARGVSYPIALLSDARTNGFGSPKALPMTYVVDRNGAIVARLKPSRAGLTEPELSAAVLPLLARPAAHE